MQKLLNFKARIITAALTLLILSMGGLSYVSFNHLADVAKQDVNDLSMLHITTGTEKISNFILRIKKDITSSANLFIGLKTDAQIMPLLTNINNLSDSSAVVVGYEDGSAVNSEKGRYDANIYDPRKRGWYLQAKNQRKTIITDVYLGRSSGALMISIATPFYSENELNGVLLADVELTALNSVIEQSVFEGANASLYDNEGITVTSTDNSFEIPGKTRLSDSSQLAALEREILSKDKGIFEYSFDGVKKVGFFQTIPLDAETHWHMLIYLNKSVVYSVLNESLKSSIFTTFILALISAILITLVLGQAYKPVLALKKTVSDLSSGHGDLTQRLPVTSQDDLGEISKNINIFVENLQNIMLDVADSSGHIGDSISGLHGLTKKNAVVLNEHMSETDQVVTALHEMSATSADVAKNTVQAVNFTGKTSEQTQSSKVVVTGATEMVSELVNNVEEASTHINQMDKDIAEITNVLKVIGDIADQTNLLALNAAIEAARAGEHGRGFAVVADEVRALASRTQTSTAEIQETINKLTNSSSAVINTMMITKTSCEDASAQTSLVVTDLDNISESVTGINNLNLQIATAAEEQSLVAEDISQNMSKIKEMVEEISASGAEADNEAANLAQANAHLTKIVGYFKLK